MNTSEGPICGCTVCEKIRWHSGAEHNAIDDIVLNEVRIREEEIKRLYEKIDALKVALKAVL